MISARGPGLRRRRGRPKAYSITQAECTGQIRHHPAAWAREAPAPRHTDTFQRLERELRRRDRRRTLRRCWPARCPIVGAASARRTALKGAAGKLERAPAAAGHQPRRQGVLAEHSFLNGTTARSLTLPGQADRRRHDARPPPAACRSASSPFFDRHLLPQPHDRASPRSGHEGFSGMWNKAERAKRQP